MLYQRSNTLTTATPYLVLRTLILFLIMSRIRDQDNASEKLRPVRNQDHLCELIRALRPMSRALGWGNHGYLPRNLGSIFSRQAGEVMQRMTARLRVSKVFAPTKRDVGPNHHCCTCTHLSQMGLFAKHVRLCPQLGGQAVLLRWTGGFSKGTSFR